MTLAATMLRSRRLALAVALAAFACDLAAATAPAAMPPTVKLAVGTQQATPAGATFTVPAGWSFATARNAVTLATPEGDSHVAIVDVAAKDAASAAAAAWAFYRPGANLPLKFTTKQAPLNGWEERLGFEYATPPAQHRVVYAIAVRAGTSWTAWIVDANEATFDKRGPQFSLVNHSVAPAPRAGRVKGK